MASGRAIEACVFDAYGTLFDVGAAARRVAAESGLGIFQERWPEIAQAWRVRQLEYTWLRTIAGVHADFWQVTQEALDWTLEREGLDDRPEIRDRLLDLYWTLDAYVEVPAALAHLQEEGHALAILSNGSEKMLAAAVEAAGIGDLLEATLSVDQVGVFKPDARVYAMVGARFGIVPAAVAFVSSNGWDAAAAAGYGFRSIWVNREGTPVERLPWRPECMVADLSQVPDVVQEWSQIQ